MNLCTACKTKVRHGGIEPAIMPTENSALVQTDKLQLCPIGGQLVEDPDGERSMQHIHVGSVVDLRLFIKVILTMPQIIALRTVVVSYILDFEESSAQTCSGE